MQGAYDSVLVEDDVAAQPVELVAHATALTVAGTLDSILGRAGFGIVLHPGHAVAVRIQEAHPWPARIDEHQVGWYRLVVFVAVDDIEGLGEGQEMCTWIGFGDPAHAVQVFAAKDVAGDVPAEEPRLRLGDCGRDLFEILVRMMLGQILVPPPRCAGRGVEP